MRHQHIIVGTKAIMTAETQSKAMPAARAGQSGAKPVPATQHIGFMLLPDFALMSYASAIEPLRAANLLAGQPIYKVLNYSATGGNVLSSSGTMVPTTPLSQAPTSLHTLFVCAGGHPSQWQAPGMLGSLRKLALWGVRMGAFQAGLMFWLLPGFWVSDGLPSIGNMPRPDRSVSRSGTRTRPLCH